MARSPLTETQRKVRRLLVKSGGTMTNPEIADELGVDRVTVWRARKAIEQHRPLPEYSRDENAEIKAHLKHLDDLADQLVDELGDNEHALATLAAGESRVGLMQIRLGLLKEMRSLENDRAEYLMNVGKVRRVPAGLLLTPNKESDLSDLDDPEKLDAEIAKYDRILDVVGARRS